MDILWWGLTIVLFALSFVGIIYPIIPSVVAIWGGFAVYQFLINPDELSLWFWISMVVLSGVINRGQTLSQTVILLKSMGGQKHPRQ